MSLLAHGVDFLENASINLLIALALGWSAAWRARVGIALSGILLIPAVSALWTTWDKVVTPVPPGPVALSLTGT